MRRVISRSRYIQLVIMAFARRQAFQQLVCLSRSLNSVAACCAPSTLNATAAVASSTISHRPWQASAWAWQSSRAFQSNAPSIQQLLDGVSATQLRDALADESQTRPFMTHQELLQFIIAQKAADSEEEAEQRADILAKAGVVLRFNGMVYLRPEEVSEMVYRLLPTDPRAAERNLSAVEQELTEMDKQYRQITSHAKRWPRRWLVLGCTALAAQFFGFMYLTWWELSWDVMEPVAYFVSLAYSLFAYMYFLKRGSYLEQREFREHWEQQLLEKRMAAAGFDLDRYHHLRRTRDRYKRYMAANAPVGQGNETVATDGKLKYS